MMEQSPAQEFDAELNRVVTRLRTIALIKLPEIATPVEQLTAELLHLCSNFGDPAPQSLPSYELRASGDVVMVLATDARKAAQDDQQILQVTAALTAARRALP